MEVGRDWQESLALNQSTHFEVYLTALSRTTDRKLRRPRLIAPTFLKVRLRFLGFADGIG